MSDNQIRLLFGEPDFVDIRTLGTATPKPWQGLVYGYSMAGEEGYWAVVHGNSFNFANVRGSWRLNSYTINVKYPDEQVRPYATIPPELEVVSPRSGVSETTEPIEAMAKLGDLFTEKMNIAGAAHKKGDFARAEQAGKEAFVIAELITSAEKQIMTGPLFGDTYRSMACFWLGYLYESEKRYDLAEPFQRMDVDICRKSLSAIRALQPPPGVLELEEAQSFLAEVLTRYAALLRMLNKTDQAEDAEREAKALFVTTGPATSP